MAKSCKEPAQELNELEAEFSELKILISEIIRNYQARLESEIDQIRGKIIALKENQVMRKTVKQDILNIQNLLRNMSTKPERGRRKDLKKIEDLICEALSLADRW